MAPGRSGGFHVEIDGMRQLRRDLKAIDRTLPRKLNAELKQAAEPIRAEAARTAPRSRVNRPGYVHFGDSLKVGTRGSKVVITSRKPGARVIEFGGRHPLFGNRDRWYPQRGARSLDRASARYAWRVERDVARTVERVMRDAGFH